MHSKQLISEPRQKKIKQIIKRRYNKQKESLNLGTSLRSDDQSQYWMDVLQQQSWSHLK